MSPTVPHSWPADAHAPVSTSIVVPDAVGVRLGEIALGRRRRAARSSRVSARPARTAARGRSPDTACPRRARRRCRAARRRGSSSGTARRTEARAPPARASRAARPAARTAGSARSRRASRAAGPRRARAAGGSSAVCAAPSTCRSSVSSRSSLPASRSCMIAAAVNVFVIEPMRYCVSGVASRPASTSAAPTAVSQIDLAVAEDRGRDARRTLLALFAPRPAARGFAARRSESQARTAEHLLHPLDRLLDLLVADVEVRDGAQPARAKAADPDAALRAAARAGRARREWRRSSSRRSRDRSRSPPRAASRVRGRRRAARRCGRARRASPPQRCPTAGARRRTGTSPPRPARSSQPGRRGSRRTGSRAPSRSRS